MNGSPSDGDQSQSDQLEERKSVLTKGVEDHKAGLATALERVKHDLTQQRETAAREARVGEVIYLEAGQHMRSINSLFWQVPGLAIAVTGGLWFGASTIVDPEARRMVLTFTALSDLLLIFVVIRMRYLFQISLDFQLAYEAKERSSRLSGTPISKGRFRYVVVGMWSTLMFLAAAVSAVGALYPDRIEHYSVRERAKAASSSAGALGASSSEAITKQNATAKLAPAASAAQR